MLTGKNIYLHIHLPNLYAPTNALNLEKTKQFHVFDLTKPCFPLKTESLSFSGMHSGDKMLLKCFMASLALEPPCWNEEWELSGHLAGVHCSFQFKPHFPLCRRDRVKNKQKSCFYFLIKEGRKLLVFWMQKMGGNTISVCISGQPF